MKALREKGELGAIYSIMGSYLQDWLFLATDYNWRLEPEQSGESKAVADIGSHLLDIIEYISGLEITEVFADFSTIHPVRKKSIKPIETYSGKLVKANVTVDVPVVTEDYATVLLRFNNNTKGVATVSQVAAGRKNRLTLEISAANKTLNWHSEKPGELWIGYRDAPNTLLLRDPSLVDADAASIISYPGGHNEGFPDTSKQLFKEIYAAVRSGAQPAQPSYPTFKSGLRELILCEKIIESNKIQQWVKI
jgi:predicted dehydrogenase